MVRKFQCTLVYSLIICVFVFSCNEKANNNLSVDFSGVDPKVDSVFSYYFGTLDSLQNPGRFPTTDQRFYRVQIIDFLSEISGIEAEGNTTYYGMIDVSKATLDSWKYWYEQKKTQIFWNDGSNRPVIR